MSEDEQQQIFLDLLKQFTQFSTEFEAVRAKKQRWVNGIFKVTEALQSKRGRLEANADALAVDGRTVPWPSSSDFAGLLDEEKQLHDQLHALHGQIRRFEWGQKIELSLPPDDHPYQYHPTIMT